jgi:hypothetical protein
MDARFAPTSSFPSRCISVTIGPRQTALMRIPSLATSRAKPLVRLYHPTRWKCAHRVTRAEQCAAQVENALERFRIRFGKRRVRPSDRIVIYQHYQVPETIDLPASPSLAAHAT